MAKPYMVYATSDKAGGVESLHTTRALAEKFLTLQGYTPAPNHPSLWVYTHGRTKKDTKRYVVGMFVESE